MSNFTPIPQAELDEMQAREEAATEGPWDVDHWYVYDKHEREQIFRAGQDTLKKHFVPNAHFAAHARTDQPRLRIAYEALRAENEKLREGLRGVKLRHRICRINCMSIPGPCDCGATEHNARIDALLEGEGTEE